MKKIKKLTLQQTLPWILIIGGIVGLIASFVLTMDKMTLLQNPGYQPSCNINPILSCGSVIRTKQAAAFGFPNPFIGLASYAVLVTVGAGLLAGAVFKRWFWRGLQVGTVFGFLFIHWLAYQSIYSIGALCLYCMAVWSVTAPIFWYTTLYNLREGHISLGKRAKKIAQLMQKHHADILVGWYLLIIALILQHFWYYWKTLI